MEPLLLVHPNTWYSLQILLKALPICIDHKLCPALMRVWPAPKKGWQEDGHHEARGSCLGEFSLLWSEQWWFLFCYDVLAIPAALAPVWPMLGKGGKEMELPCSNLLNACTCSLGQSLSTSKSSSKPSAPSAPYVALCHGCLSG